MNEDIQVTGIEAVIKSNESEIKEAKDVMDFIAYQEIESSEDVQNMIYSLLEIKKTNDDLKEQKNYWTGKLKEYLKQIETPFKVGLKYLDNAESQGRYLIQKFLNKQDDKKKELLKLAESTEGYIQKASIIQQALQFDSPKYKNMSITKEWTGVVQDEEELLKYLIENQRYDLLSINEKAINELTKSVGTNPGLPGWDAYSQNNLRIYKDKEK